MQTILFWYQKQRKISKKCWNMLEHMKKHQMPNWMKKKVNYFHLEISFFFVCEFWEKIPVVLITFKLLKQIWKNFPVSVGLQSIQLVNILLGMYRLSNKSLFHWKKENLSQITYVIQAFWCKVLFSLRLEDIYVEDKFISLLLHKKGNSETWPSRFVM